MSSRAQPPPRPPNVRDARASHPPGPHVVQVARTMGDSLLELHYADPRAGRDRRPPTRLLIALGAAFLLTSLFAFSRGVSVAAENQRARAEWNQSRAAWRAQFRPRRLSLAYDFFAFGGLAGGIVALAAAIAVGRSQRARDRLTAGSSADADIAMDGIAVDIDLVRTVGGTTLIEVPRGSVARRTTAEGSEPVSGAIELGLGHRLELRSGATALEIKWVARQRGGQLAGSGRVDRRVLGFVAASALAHLAVLALMQTIPPDRSTMSDDSFAGIERMHLVSNPATEPPIELPPEPGTGGNSSGDPAAGDNASSGAEGTTGTPDAEPTRGRIRVQRRADEPQLARVTVEMAKRAGILGAYMRNERRFTDITSNNPFASGLDDRDIYGGPDGDMDADTYSPWDSGWGGEKSTSDSPYWGDGGTVVVGKLPTGGGPTGEGWSTFGGDGENQRGHRRTLPMVETGPVTSSCASVDDPCLDKSIVRRYIKRHTARIRHCYERALLADAGLRGSVLTHFIISPEGKVQGSVARGIGGTALTGCVARAVSSIKFPKSAGAGVRVTYPFRFAPAGS